MKPEIEHFPKLTNSLSLQNLKENDGDGWHDLLYLRGQRNAVAERLKEFFSSEEADQLVEEVIVSAGGNPAAARLSGRLYCGAVTDYFDGFNGWLDYFRLFICLCERVGDLEFTIVTQSFAVFQTVTIQRA